MYCIYCIVSTWLYSYNDKWRGEVDGGILIDRHIINQSIN
jgi:hypothetical protein